MVKVKSLIPRLFPRLRRKRSGGIQSFKKYHHPVRDWVIILLIVFLFLFAIFVWGWRIYQSFFVSLGEGESMKTGTPRPVDQQRLREIIQYYEKKESIFRKYGNAPIRVIDPSQ